jgi:hypothetical protein
MDRQMLEDGVNTMLKVAMDILASKRSKISSTSDEQGSGGGDGPNM